MTPHHPRTRLAAAAALCAAAVGLASASPSAATSSSYAFSTSPKLLMVHPAGKGYNLVFRLNRPIPRRADGSFDAGTRTAAGFASEFMTADKRHNCYFAAVSGQSKHVGTQVSVRLLLGDGHDPVGKVSSVKTLTPPRLTASQGTAGRHGSFKAEAAAARTIGCTHVDRHLG